MCLSGLVQFRWRTEIEFENPYHFGLTEGVVCRTRKLRLTDRPTDRQAQARAPRRMYTSRRRQTVAELKLPSRKITIL